MHMLLRFCLLACTSASALTPSPRTPVIRMAAARATAPVFDGKPYSAEVLPATVGRSSAVLAGSAALFAACVPGLPDWWSTASLDPGACSVPLLTMAASSALVAAGWSACGTDLHPITAKARGVTPPKSYTFQLLGLSAPLLASAAVASGWQPLPVTYQPQRHLGDTSATHRLPLARWPGAASSSRTRCCLSRCGASMCDWANSRVMEREREREEEEEEVWSVGVRVGQAGPLAPFPGTFSEPSRNRPGAVLLGTAAALAEPACFVERRERLSARKLRRGARRLARAVVSSRLYLISALIGQATRPWVRCLRASASWPSRCAPVARAAH